ncbi:uncharacterized protein TRAVEDRAFT_75286 [Trametes versicolor FP-101664 SS1]|uniref:uncharacterized protein n=1 Tax=Trametes versicolor (strain FP-101664) TaxID=717944 RepID=UPI00046231CF|nr:uncharacterized protein TRAVEDRAFT_75286 [Trametes versicolor FP-101664 SS1]EIW52213.1 hypothetical protein TRAVEDRAFT_75286 [Trametes versicolor FP-101664 SS1]
MFARSFFILSVLSSTFALYTNYYPRGYDAALGARADSPADQDLLNSCPGGPGSSAVEHADKCTLVNIVNNPNTRTFTVLGDPQLNCGGATDPVTVTLGGQQTITETTTVDANIGVSLEGVTIGGGASSSSSTANTVSKTISYTVPPGRQAVFVAGTAQQSQTGNVQVNYADRQFGHFIWFTGATVTQLTPITSDVEFDVHETACGTDPRDINNHS